MGLFCCVIACFFLQGKALFDQAKHLVDEFADYEAARAKLFEAADKYKYPPALNEYGEYLYYGRGGPTDEAEAVKYFQGAADLDDPTGLYNLANMYFCKRGGLHDEEKAKELFLKSAEKGHAMGKSHYDTIVEQQEMRKHDIEAVQGVIAAAEGGDAEAKFKLAQYYLHGATGIDQNNQKALEYLRPAADAGHVPAMLYLGQCYDYAYLDLQEDDVTALDWYRRAAEKGDETASHKIGEFYENGYGGLQVNIEAAKENYRKGGEMGQVAIDRIETCARNRAELQRLKEAAEAGDVEAQYKLGQAYNYGQLGLAMDERKAAELFRPAADAGHAMSQCWLGMLYLVKDWLEPDHDLSLDLAKKYLQLAADQGDTEAASYIRKYFSGRSTGDNEGYFAVVSGVRRADGKVVVEFEATGDGSDGAVKVPRCAAAPLLHETRPAPLRGERADQRDRRAAAGTRIAHLRLPPWRLRKPREGHRAGRALRPHPGRRQPAGRLARVPPARGAEGGPGPRRVPVRPRHLLLLSHPPGPARVTPQSGPSESPGSRSLLESEFQRAGGPRVGVSGSRRTARLHASPAASCRRRRLRSRPAHPLHPDTRRSLDAAIDPIRRSKRPWGQSPGCWTLLLERLPPPPPSPLSLSPPLSPRATPAVAAQSSVTPTPTPTECYSVIEPERPNQ